MTESSPSPYIQPHSQLLYIWLSLLPVAFAWKWRLLIAVKYWWSSLPQHDVNTQKLKCFWDPGKLDFSAKWLFVDWAWLRIAVRECSFMISWGSVHFFFFISSFRESAFLIVSGEEAGQHMIMNEAMMQHLIILFIYHFLRATLVIGKYDLIVIRKRLMEGKSGRTVLLVTTCRKTLILNWSHSYFIHAWFINKLWLFWITIVLRWLMAKYPLLLTVIVQGIFQYLKWKAFLEFQLYE
jgi:hypothetical protein